MASAATARSAPCRTSPVISARRNACSGSVARPNRSSTASRRAAAEPLPDSAATWSNAASTSVTSSDGSSAGGGSSRSIAQPTPSGRWRGSPARKPTPARVSASGRPAKHSASSATFSLRDEVAATAFDVSTTVVNRIDTRG